MSEQTTSHLWEPEHPWDPDRLPYRGASRFYDGGYHQDFPTWGDFMADMGGWDLEANLLFRWDWNKPAAGVMGTLILYFMGQRHSRNHLIKVAVHPDEEPEVRAYLQSRLEHLLALWAPLVPEPVELLAWRAEQ